MEPTAQSNVTAPITKPAENKQITEEKNIPSFKGTKHKITVNGKESEIDYDMLIRDYQNSKASDEKFKQASSIRKEIDGIISAIQKGDYSQMINLVGKDAYRKAAEEFLLKELEYQNLPEHEKRRLLIEQERDEYKKKLDEVEQSKKTAREKMLMDRAYQEIDDEITQAIRESGLKPTPLIVSRMAELMLANLETNKKKIDAKSALNLTRKQLEKDLDDFISQADIDTLKSRMPKKFIDALRKADVDELIKESSVRNPRKDFSEKGAVKSKKKYRSTDEWFDNLSNKLRRR